MAKGCGFDSCTNPVRASGSIITDVVSTARWAFEQGPSVKAEELAAKVLLYGFELIGACDGCARALAQVVRADPKRWPECRAQVRSPESVALSLCGVAGAVEGRLALPPWELRALRACLLQFGCELEGSCVDCARAAVMSLEGYLGAPRG
jgi:hypothetical protein